MSSKIKKCLNCDVIKLWKDLICLYREEPIFTCQAHVFYLQKTKTRVGYRRTWLAASSPDVSVSFYYDSFNKQFKIISIQGLKGLVNSCINHNSRLVKVSGKFLQWSDQKTFTVYGLGFDSEEDLTEFWNKFYEIRELVRRGKKYERTDDHSKRKKKEFRFNFSSATKMLRHDNLANNEPKNELDDIFQPLSSTESIKNFVSGECLIQIEAEMEMNPEEKFEKEDLQNQSCFERKRELELSLIDVLEQEIVDLQTGHSDSDEIRKASLSNGESKSENETLPDQSPIEAYALEKNDDACFISGSLLTEVPSGEDKTGPKCSCQTNTQEINELKNEIASLRSSLSKVEFEFSTCREIQDHQFEALEDVANQLGENLKSLSQLYCQLTSVLHKFKRDVY